MKTLIATTAILLTMMGTVAFAQYDGSARNRDQQSQVSGQHMQNNENNRPDNRAAGQNDQRNMNDQRGMNDRANGDNRDHRGYESRAGYYHNHYHHHRHEVCSWRHHRRHCYWSY